MEWAHQLGAVERRCQALTCATCSHCPPRSGPWRIPGKAGWSCGGGVSGVSWRVGPGGLRRQRADRGRQRREGMARRAPQGESRERGWGAGLSGSEGEATLARQGRRDGEGTSLC